MRKKDKVINYNKTYNFYILECRKCGFHYHSLELNDSHAMLSKTGKIIKCVDSKKRTKK